MSSRCWNRFRNKAKFQNFQSLQCVIDGEKLLKNDTNVRAAVLLSGAETLLAKIQGMKGMRAKGKSGVTKD